MKRSLLLTAILLLSAGVFQLQQNSAQETPDKEKPTDDYKIPAADAARVNPVKSSSEGLAGVVEVECEGATRQFPLGPSGGKVLLRVAGESCRVRITLAASPA